MPLQCPPRSSSVLASALAAVGIVLAVASCSHVAPLGPVPVATPGRAVAGPPVAIPQPRHLGSPIILQVMRSEPPTAAGGCPAGWVAVPKAPGGAPMPCFRPVGTPVTITSAGVSSVFLLPSAPGHPPVPPSYGFMVAVPTAEVAAVTAVIRQAYDSRRALGVSVAGKTLDALQIVGGPFPGQQLQIALPSRHQALRVYRILVPST
jgi:hypothetical protein